MAEITSGQLIQDWYDRYVRPLKQPMEGIFSGAKPDFSLGTPPSTNPLGYRGPGITAPPSLVTLQTAPAEAPIAPTDVPQPYDAEPAMPDTNLVPDTETPTPEGVSWSDKLTKGLQDPAKMGLLGMGLSMMATPPRPVKYSGAEIIGNAGLHGLKFFQQAVEEKRKTDLMAQTAEEHKLAREDRRQANEDRAQYYRDQAETKKMNAESLAQSRVVNEAYRKQLETNVSLLAAPVPDAVWDANGHPELKGKGITGNQYKEYGMAAWTKGPGMAVTTSNKGDVTITPKVPGTYPGIGKSKTTPAGAGGEGPGKTAAIALINKEVVSQYLPIAREEISKNAPPGSERMRQMVESLNTQDPTTGGPNEAKVREQLSPKQREELDFVKRKAQEYSKTMVPAAAVQKARDDWNAKHPAPKTDARYEEYRRVYEEIRNYTGWSNAEKNAKIKEMNDKARRMGLIK